MSIQLKPLEQQVMVITGASSGIGLAIAEAAAKKGVSLVLTARSAEVLGDIVEELTSAGAQVVSVPADVSRREDVQRVADVAVSRFGRIDTWVNDAGLSIYGRLDEVPDDDSRRLFDINFWGVVNGSFVALPHLKKNGGALINVGSEVSEAVVPLQGMYTASKHAVKGFTDTLRVEIEEMDKAPVAITLIQPTAVDTPFPEHARNYMDKEPKLPEPKIDPERVAEAVLKAATHHSRDVKVGAGAVLNTAVAKVAPSLADRLSAKRASQQQREEPPRQPDGTLDRPGQAGRTRGRPDMPPASNPRR
jgi:short-subunit dehydrogenase